MLIITYCMLKPIVGLTFEKNSLEGFLRFQHVRVREWGESIAFFNVCCVLCATPSRNTDSVSLL